MSILLVQETVLEKCYRQCPYYIHELGVRNCDHPKASNAGYIIPKNIKEISFPDACPLLMENGDHTRIRVRKGRAL
jgi:hypothetical protein